MVTSFRNFERSQALACGAWVGWGTRVKTGAWPGSEVGKAGLPGVAVARGDFWVGSGVAAGGRLISVNWAATVRAAAVLISSNSDGAGVFRPGILQALSKTIPISSRLNPTRKTNLPFIARPLLSDMHLL
jgi:hypothetical protein